MTEKAFEVLSWRFRNRDKEKPWVFWHRYWSTKKASYKVGDLERQAMAIYEQARKKSHTDSQTEEGAEKKRIRHGHLTLLKY